MTSASPPSPSTASRDPLPEGLHVLDVREDVEWRHGHIEGAHAHPAARAPGAARRAARRADAGGVQGRRPLGAGRRLPAQQGHDAVNLDGGMLDWADAGRPMVSETGGAPAGGLSPGVEPHPGRPRSRVTAEGPGQRKAAGAAGRGRRSSRGTPRGAPSPPRATRGGRCATARRAAAGRRARRGAGRPARPAPPSRRRVTRWNIDSPANRPPIATPYSPPTSSPSRQASTECAQPSSCSRCTPRRSPASIQPASRARVGAGGDHLVERGVDPDLHPTHRLPQRPGHPQPVERQHPRCDRRPPQHRQAPGRPTGIGNSPCR